ncbi:MAG: hypothetical protein K0M70_07685, partial [Arenimonas sp.]|uniref:chemotaxis protein CheB n=1 Tax=Arenimonas sp. TaxID=1872635 RepID=UPI0025BD1628
GGARRGPPAPRGGGAGGGGGPQLVIEGDPAELDPGQVAGEQPTVVLVSLEPAIEDSLARFDELLSAPGIEVMYDDAETTRQLDGWDLARWARHLATKLVGTDLLPPAPGGSDHLPELSMTLEPGAPRTPAQEMVDAKLEDYAAESLDLSEWVPTEPSLASAQISPVAPAAQIEAASPEPLAEPDMSFDIDLGGLELALEDDDAAPATPSLRPVAAEADDLEFNAADFDIDLSALPDEDSPLPTANDPELLAADDVPLLADLPMDGGPVSFSSFTDEEAPLDEHMDDDVAALAAQLDAYEAQERQPEPVAIDFTRNDEPSPSPGAAAGANAEVEAPAARVTSSFGSLELMPMDAEISAPAAAEPPVVRQVPAAAPVSRMSLANVTGDGPIDNLATAPGALLVIAGLGGPDAVRQLLSALPPTLRVPVLLYQHLDTGRHERLLGQLAKASQLPLDLAVEGKIAFSGRVGVLPPGMGVAHNQGSFVYVAVPALADLASALPASESVVLLLSGADPSVVPAVLALHNGGGMVLAQDPESCFDATAAGLLIDAGAIAASPAELARIVIERWK